MVKGRTDIQIFFLSRLCYACISHNQLHMLMLIIIIISSVGYEVYDL